MKVLLLFHHTILLVVQLLPSVNAQQAPFYPVDTVETQRTNFCERHNLVEGGELTRRDALRGMEIKTALYPYQLENGVISPNDPGIGILFMDAIAERGGFKWRDAYGLHPVPTANQTWDEILYRANGIYDMSAEWYWRTIERMSHGMLFPEGFYDGSLIMIGLKQDFANKSTFNIWAFMAPFNQDVWFLILGTMIVSAVVFYLIQYLENSLLNPSDSLFVTAFSFTGHYFFLPKTNATRLYSFSICALALMMVSAYTANLTSFLVLLNQPVSPIEEIRDAVALGNKICVYGNSVPEYFMQQYYPSARLVRTIDDPAILRNIDAGECSIGLVTISSWESAKGDKELNGDCNKKWMGRVVKFQHAGFPIGDSQGLCTSLLRDVVEIIMVDMKNDGSFDRIWRDHREKRNTNSCDSSSKVDEDALTESVRLSVNNVGGMFVFYAISLAVAVLFAVFSYWVEWRKLQPSTTRHSTEVGDLMTKKGMRGSATMPPESSPRDTPQKMDRQFTDDSRCSHTRTSTSRYTDDVFTSDGDPSQILFSTELHHGRAISRRASGLTTVDGSNPLEGLQKLLEEKDARDKQLQQEISRLLNEVSYQKTEMECAKPRRRPSAWKSLRNRFDSNDEPEICVEPEKEAMGIIAVQEEPEIIVQPEKAPAIYAEIDI